MNDVTATPSPSAAPPAPAAAAPAGAPPPSASTGAPTAADTPASPTRPEWLPEQYWDGKAGALNTDEFGKHYGEIAANAAKFAERAAAVPEKPEGYKVELKLPDTVKVPEGVTFDPAKDPRLPLLTKLAHERGWSNDDVNALAALDAQMVIAAHNSHAAYLLAEDKKLGDKPAERRVALKNRLDVLAGKGDITAEERAQADTENMNAAGVILIEKLLDKITGSIPGHVPNSDPRPAPKSAAERMYPHLPSGLPPASARSA